MIGPNHPFRNAAQAAQAYFTDAFKEILEMVDLLLEGSVVALSWVGRAVARISRSKQCRQRPLQVIRAMSMVSDHVMRDVGLDRSAIGAISELSVEDVHGCRVERQVS